VKFKDSDPTSQ